MEKITKTAQFFAILITLSLSAFLTIGTSDIHAVNVSALSFDGSNDYINANNVSERLVGTSELSFGMWARRTDFSVNLKGLGGFYSSTGGNDPVLFWGTNVNPGKFVYSDDVIGTGGQIASRTFNTTAWHQVFVTIDAANTVNLYVDGVLEATTTSTSRPTANGRFTIGQDWDLGTATDFFNGQIDEVRVYNRVLTRGEIQRDMYRELTGTENGLIAYYKMDENTGCTLTDSAGGDDPGTLIPTTCPADGPVYTQEMPTLNNTSPDLPPGTITNSRGGWLYSGRTVGATGTTITKVDYSINGAGYTGATATDGAFSSNGENFEAFFQSTDNGNTYPGYVLSLRATDSTEKVAKRTHFDPFNLSSVKKVDDNQLEFTFNVNKQRTLMKDQLDRYKIIYSPDGSGDKTLLDDIAIDFETVRSKLQNQATNGISCDPCVYDNGKMTLSYLDNNSQLTVVTKKAPTLTGNTTFKVMAVSPDKFEQNSNSLTLESTSGQVRSASTQLSAAGETGTKPEEETGEKKLPGQKTTFKETPLSGEAGPIAGIINGVISTILGIWEKIGSFLPRI